MRDWSGESVCVRTVSAVHLLSWCACPGGRLEEHAHKALCAEWPLFHKENVYVEKY